MGGVSIDSVGIVGYCILFSGGIDRLHIGLNEVLVTALIGVHVLIGADLIGGHRPDKVHVLVILASRLGIASEQSVQPEEEVELPELILAQELAIELLLKADQIRHQAVLDELHSLMLDVVVRGSFEVRDHVRRDAVDGGDLGLLELASGDELRILRRDADALVGHTAFKQQRGVGVMQAHRLGDEVTLEALVGFRLEGGWVLEHAGHVTALIEEALAVLLGGGGQGQVLPVDGNRALALVAIGGEATQVDHVVGRYDLTLVGTVVELIVIGQVGLHLGWVHQLQAHRAEQSITMDAGVSVAPEGAADHQVVQQGKAGGVGVGLGEDLAAGMLADRLAAIGGAAVEVDRQGADRLGEDAHAGPHCGEVKCPFLADVRTFRGIGNGVGEKGRIHCGFELRRRGRVTFLPMTESKDF